MDMLTWDSIFDTDEVSLIVDKTAIKDFLKELGNSVDEKGFVIDENNKKRVISQDEDEIKLKDLGSISSGSKNFIKDNIASYTEFLAQKRSL